MAMPVPQQSGDKAAPFCKLALVLRRQGCAPRRRKRVVLRLVHDLRLQHCVMVLPGRSPPHSDWQSLKSLRHTSERTCAVDPTDSKLAVMCLRDHG